MVQPGLAERLDQLDLVRGADRPGSIWNPSRGPSSWISTWVGKSVIILFLAFIHENVARIVPDKHA
jgi:hypothetical protein